MFDLDSKELFLLSEARKAKKKKKTEREKDEAEKKTKEEQKNAENNKKNKQASGHYAFNKPRIPSVSLDLYSP